MHKEEITFIANDKNGKAFIICAADKAYRAHATNNNETRVVPTGANQVPAFADSTIAVGASCVA